ncbi:MAG: nucleoside deaminase [Candidatus Levybacteria bacterium]|nr:nucleoside deaminase [Candidatus Levybacteria bacterium]
MEDKQFLKLAVDQARESLQKGGFPAGAIIVKDGKIVSKGISLGFILNDPTSHAETAAIREACKNLKISNLEGATLYESLECCTMCFSVANWAGISRIVAGCKKTSGMVSKGYYEGATDVKDLNQQNTRKIELAYIPDFEKESLEIVKDWENKNQSSSKI